MTSIRTTKKPLTGWVSPEIYGKVTHLCTGDDAPYRSVSEYIVSLVNRDLAIREHTASHPEAALPGAAQSDVAASEPSALYGPGVDFTSSFLAALEDPGVIDKLKLLLQK